MKPSSTERLTGVAIKREGVIYSLPHYYGGHKVMRDNLVAKKLAWMLDGDIEGFITSTGRFVNRAEAKAVALLAGQLGQQWSGPTREVLSSDINW